MDIDHIIHTLETFVPFPEGDPTNDTQGFLYALMEEWKKTPGKEKTIPAIFRLIETYPHVNFGSPGPLVHALESPSVDYQGALQVSLLRRPTPLTLWMYNRTINADKNESIIRAHISRLRLFAKHPLADDDTKKEALSFADYQESRLAVS